MRGQNVSLFEARPAEKKEIQKNIRFDKKQCGLVEW